MISARFNGSDIRPAVNCVAMAQLEAGKEYELTIKEYKERRSLKANAYSWALTDKLAEKMLVAGVKLSKEEMHSEMIFRYGQTEICNGAPVTMSVLEGIKVSEYYPYAREIGQSETHGKMFSHWRIYRGSHTYDKREMALFIKGICEECRDLGIPTETPEEIARMISLMKEAENG